jgi:hypothetical protein
MTRRRHFPLHSFVEGTEHRGQEIRERTFKAHAQTIFDQAENRLHVQKKRSWRSCREALRTSGRLWRCGGARTEASPPFLLDIAALKLFSDEVKEWSY